MGEENQQPPATGSQPSQGPPQSPQATDSRKNPQERQNEGQRRRDRRDRPRHHGGRRDHHRRDQYSQQPPQQRPPGQLPPEPEDADADDDEETRHDRPSPQGRHHYRGGRPPKKIIEEWANDPYCE